MGSRARIWAATVILAALLALPGSAAAAGFRVDGFSIATSTHQAGAHPDMTVATAFPSYSGAGTARVRTVRLGLPAGVLGNPGATAVRCTELQFQASACPAASRVGSVSVRATAVVLGVPIASINAGSVFNLVPPPGQPARLGFAVTPTLPGVGLPIGADIRVPIAIALRPDGGLDLVLTELPSSVLLVFGPAQLYADQVTLTLEGRPHGGRPPFMTNPTSCGAHGATLAASAYDGTGDQASASITTTGCGAVPFTPGASMATETSQRGAPSGYSITLTVPGTEEPVRQAHVRRADVVMPPGTTLSPGVAAGLEACTDAQFGTGSAAPPQCSAASRIGSVQFATPLLATGLHGQVYFAAATPARALGLFVAVDQSGVRLKLAGAIRLDPATGQITTVFDELPQVPFTSLMLTLEGGARAVLANPTACGEQRMTTRLTPWSGGAPAGPSAAFTTDADGAGGACAAPAFRPALAIAVADRSAGRPAGAVTLTLTRPDGDQAIGRVVADFPPGLAGSLTGVGICPEVRVATGDCPVESRVGSVVADIGSETAPATLHGTVYLTGAAQGGLAGLAIVIAGRLGPIDLGTVVTRTGIVLRATDAGLTVRTANLPRMVGGIPISIRRLALTLDRPGFMRNASSCRPLTVGATFTSQAGATATAAVPYQAERCAALAFAPRISAAVGRGRKPTLTTVIALPPGQAATKAVTVTLPKGVGIDLQRLANRCTVDQASANRCPDAARIGSATARTPLLPVPLTGSVYLADLPGSQLPGLLVAFDTPVPLKLAGTVAFSPRGLQTTFSTLPDVPLERLELDLAGGAQGVLWLPPGKNLCTGAPPEVAAAFTAHSGATAADHRAAVVAGCGPQATITLTHPASRRPRLALTVRRAPDGPALGRVRLQLPRRLAADPHRAAHGGLTARAGARRLASALTRRGLLTVRAPNGAATITAVLRKGAFRARQRLGNHPAMRFELRVTDANGATTTTMSKAQVKP